MAVIVRNMREGDLDAVAAILNEQIEASPSLWMDEPIDRANRIAWLAERRAHNFPAFVAEENESILGFCSYGWFRAFSGYRHTMEHSVYIKTGRRGQGLGGMLMQPLLNHAQKTGVHVMVAAIGLPNDASVALHSRLGFVETGRMPEVATKFGAWRDLLLMQKILIGNPDACERM